MENTSARMLQFNIEELGLSRTAVHFFEANRMHTLQDLLKTPMANWFAYTGFSQHLLNEFMNFFESERLLGFVQE